MLLAIDIGNTNISIGVFEDKRLWKRYSIPAKEKKYSVQLQKIFRQNKIHDAIICSVVPSVTKILAKDIERLLGQPPYIIGKDIVVPINNLYRKPRQVGQDRLVNAYAGIMLYGAPLIVVDFGTAVTFDLVSKDKAYLGGMILPGLEISLDALAERTALLPKIKLTRPEEFIGRDTKNSMLSGIIYGFSSLADSLIKKLKQKLGKNAQVIATGGNISLISNYCRKINKINRDLTLQGLCLLFLRHNI